MKATKQIRSFDGITINYKIKKTNNPYIIYIHGLGCNETVWTSFKTSLPNFSHVSLDLRGHGKSEIGDISLSNYAKDVITIMKHEKITNPIIISHCIGVNITLELSKHVKIQKSILLGPSLAEFIKHRKLWAFLGKKCLFFWPFFKVKKKPVDYSKFKNIPPFIGTLIDLRHTSSKVYSQSIKTIDESNLSLKNHNPPTLLYISKKDILLNHKKILNSTKPKQMKTITTKLNHVQLVLNPQKIMPNIKKYIK